MNKIIPIAKAGKAIKPPLKKSEIIEALAIRERENIIKANDEVAAQIKATKAELYTTATDELIRKCGKIVNSWNGQPFDVNSRADGGAYSVDLKLELSPCPPNVAKLYKRLRELEKKAH